MAHRALEVIREEHQALAAMLRSLSMLLAQSRRRGEAPDFELLRAMLLYVDEFPERRHHPKESELLFPALRAKAPELGPVIDRLDRDHAQGEAAIRRLEHALLAYEVMGESRRTGFEQALQDYTRFYLEHMAVEETQLLPVARERLDEADWAALDAAFAANRDPLTGHEPEDEYRPLFQRILAMAPAPVGLGEAR
jgi:hemerythrin-like domain-containing protein